MQWAVALPGPGIIVLLQLWPVRPIVAASTPLPRPLFLLHLPFPPREAPDSTLPLRTQPPIYLARASCSLFIPSTPLASLPTPYSPTRCRPRSGPWLAPAHGRNVRRTLKPPTLPFPLSSVPRSPPRVQVQAWAAACTSSWPEWVCRCLPPAPRPCPAVRWCGLAPWACWSRSASRRRSSWRYRRGCCRGRERWRRG